MCCCYTIWDNSGKILHSIRSSATIGFAYIRVASRGYSVLRFSVLLGMVLYPLKHRLQTSESDRTQASDTKRALAIGAHPDDNEFGAGGFTAKLAAQG
jgi:hypothetical protein